VPNCFFPPLFRWPLLTVAMFSSYDRNPLFLPPLFPLLQSNNPFSFPCPKRWRWLSPFLGVELMFFPLFFFPPSFFLLAMFDTLVFLGWSYPPLQRLIQGRDITKKILFLFSFLFSFFFPFFFFKHNGTPWRPLSFFLWYVISFFWEGAARSPPQRILRPFFFFPPPETSSTSPKDRFVFLAQQRQGAG